MSGEIIGLHHWLTSAPGRYLLAWEQDCLDEAVADLFGYYALQCGMPWLPGLRTNRMAHQWLALGSAYQSPGALDGAAWPVAPTFWADAEALPFAANSLDLIVLPHTLEHSTDPHAVLREVARVLVPEGRVIVCGLNPASLWGLRQRRMQCYQRLGWGGSTLAQGGAFLGYWRLRDWLRLLSFEVESARFGCFRPALRSHYWLERLGWMDRWGERWWPILGAAYFVVAVKRVHGMRLLEPGWHSVRQRAAVAVPLAQQKIHKD